MLHPSFHQWRLLMLLNFQWRPHFHFSSLKYLNRKSLEKYRLKWLIGTDIVWVLFSLGLFCLICYVFFGSGLTRFILVMVWFPSLFEIPKGLVFGVIQVIYSEKDLQALSYFTTSRTCKSGLFKRTFLKLRKITFFGYRTRFRFSCILRFLFKHDSGIQQNPVFLRFAITVSITFPETSTSILISRIYYG